MLAAVLGVSLLAVSAPRAQQAPTLGELALREAARRKALTAAAAKVLTNADLPRGSAPATPPAAPQAQPGAETKPADDKDKPQEPQKDEAWWRSRITQAREELRRNEMYAEAIQTRINSLTNDFAAMDDPYQRARIGEDRAKAIQELDRLKVDIESGKKKIADVEEEARRAGVPPGWLR